MRMGITAMPAEGIEIYRMGAETCLVRLFKNPETTEQGETTALTADVVEMQMKFDISIHAPRMRCDTEIRNYTDTADISIHAPRMRCDYF